MSADNWITFAVIVGLCLGAWVIVAILTERQRRREARVIAANRAAWQDWQRTERQIALASFQTKAAKGFSARLRSQVCTACGHPMNGMGGMCAISWCRCVCATGLCESEIAGSDLEGREGKPPLRTPPLSATSEHFDAHNSRFHSIVGFRAKKDA